MNKLKLLMLTFILALNAGCASFGPTIRIETPEPTEDFVVLCEWHSKSIFKGGHGGGTYRSL
ncbi:MAG: hypothetical protein QM500_19750 [Methylococcales bacterium]